tara:strand:- start:572 stop:952 length:381 start_codon:yes stop_codon:yes gene_type:complete
MIKQKIQGPQKLISIVQVARYADASGDHNPLHLDETYAAGTMFGKRIAHGMLILSSIAEIMYEAFPMEWNASGSLNVKFRAPVFLGDEIAASAELKLNDGSIIVYSVKVVKQDGLEVITGEATLNI